MGLRRRGVAAMAQQAAGATGRIDDLFANAGVLNNFKPDRRNGTPEDVSGTVAWLLSDDARFVTGRNILIDGGFTLGGPRI